MNNPTMKQVVCVDLNVVTTVSELEALGGYMDFHWAVNNQINSCHGRGVPPLVNIIISWIVA